MKKGFTLIELLVVVLIMGILAAMALPQYQTAVDKARYSQLISNINSLVKAQEVYLYEYGRYATSMEDLDKSLWPAGYQLRESGALSSSDRQVSITLGYNQSRDEVYYIYSRDVRNNTGYYITLATKESSCLSYGQNNKRGERLCSNLTSKSAPDRTGNTPFDSYKMYYFKN